MPTLTTSALLREREVKNRLVLPPMVLFNTHGEDGMPNPKAFGYYERRAVGNGIIILEATAVLPEGRLDGRQLGLWNDSQTEALKPLAKAIRRRGAISLVQIHHGGPNTDPACGEGVGPSAFDHNGRSVRALSVEEIHRIRDAFICAALRAEAAGFDGVELHGAHGYLLNYFLTPEYNHREDSYGNGMQLVREIYEGIRAGSRKDMIVTLRLGVSCPLSEQDKRNARELEALGLDALNISSGVLDGTGIPKSSDFPFSALAYRGAEIKKQVTIPVMMVGGMDAPGNACKAVENQFSDFVCVGRGQLANPFWAAETLLDTSPAYCLRCPGGCKWDFANNKCPIRSICSENI